jgi:uncharacterized tellurite resistance protein B-like protein
MFESLLHWIHSIEEDSKLFRDAEDEVLHSAVASLLYHFIHLETRHGGREKHEFERLMRREFDLGQEQIDHLYEAAKTATADLHGDLQTINSHLKNKPATKMRFMQMLLRLINIHGTHPAELELFHETLHEVFPEVRDIERN